METEARISASADIDSRNVERYYEINQLMYSLFWSSEALHYGFWERGTRRISEAVRNTNQYVCDCLGIGPGDRVLDAGCGVGGVSCYVAEKTGAHVTGITLSPRQVRMAERRACRSAARERLAFFRRDFNRTGFEDGAFTRLFAIESACHAVDKLRFLEEAYRVLGNRGRMAVVDGFLARTDLDPEDRAAYDRFTSGWALPNLVTVDAFRDQMRQAGFVNVSYTDKLQSVLEAVRRIYLRGIAGYPLTLVLSGLGIIPREIHGHTITAVEQKRMADRGIVTYGVFVAEKP